MEKFPEPIKFRVIPITNFGTTSRKHLRKWRFVLDPRGGSVTFTPIMDGVSLTPQNYQYTGKETVVYYFTSDQIGVDFSGTFSSGTPFELWSILDPQSDDIEVLPDLVDYRLILPSNLGTPCKKRVRVWPFVLDTLGNNVTFTPIIDGSSGTPTTFSGSGGKQTFFHYFKTDAFGNNYGGTDYGGTLTGGPFEVHEIGKPDIVQVFPISRQYDQLGPEELFRYGRVKKLEVRILAIDTGNSQGAFLTLPYIVRFNDNQVVATNFQVVNGIEQTYEIGLPQIAGGQIVRIELGPTASSTFSFYRFYVRLLVMKSGRDTDSEWVTLPTPEETQQ
jgi:hypothetical protein